MDGLNPIDLPPSDDCGHHATMACKALARPERQLENAIDRNVLRTSKVA